MIFALKTGLALLDTDYFYSIEEQTSLFRFSSNRIVCAGDSLTRGAGGDGASYPSTLEALAGIQVLNRGYGGKASADIALHMGALKPEVTLLGGYIPASGAVSVTSINPPTGWRTEQNNETFPGILMGVEGRLIRATNNTWSFTRSSPGAAVDVPAGTEFVCTENTGDNDSITITWVGRNNYATDFAEVERDTETLNKWIGVYNKQHLVIGMTTTSGEPIGSDRARVIARVNSKLADTYQDCYLDILEYLVNQGLEDAGITPTEQDQIDITNGVMPISLRSDAVHLNAIGYQVVGRRIYQKLISLGWV